jgi:hypothetical protein
MQGPTVKEIELNFEQKNFDLRIQLQGSQDLIEWYTLLQDYRILSILNTATDYRFTRLLFPEASFRYFRIVIPSEKDPVLRTAATPQGDARLPEYHLYPPFKQRGQAVPDKKQSWWYIDLPQKLPVSWLQVHIADPVEYMRPIRIQKVVGPAYGSQAGEKEYVTIESSMLSSFSQNTFSIPAVLTDEIRLVIDHGDNVPVMIDSVTLKTTLQEVWTRLPEAGRYLMVYGDAS